MTTLLASSAPRNRTAGSLVMSALVHATLLGTAAFVTARGVTPSDAPTAIVLLFQPLRPEPTAPTGALRVTADAVSPVIVAPIVVPEGLPPIDLRLPVDDERLFTFHPTPAAWVAGSTPAGLGDAPLEAEAVERPVRLIGAQGGPHYPDALRQMGVEGRVVARFVVDTAGRVEVAFVEYVEATHQLFADAVRTALARARFVPAEAGGRRVRQLVVQRFIFSRSH